MTHIFDDCMTVEAGGKVCLRIPRDSHKCDGMYFTIEDLSGEELTIWITEHDCVWISDLLSRAKRQFREAAALKAAEELKRHIQGLSSLEN